MLFLTIMYLSAYNFAHTPCVSITLRTYSFSTTCSDTPMAWLYSWYQFLLCQSIFIITFSPYLYVCTYWFFHDVDYKRVSFILAFVFPSIRFSSFSCLVMFLRFLLLSCLSILLCLILPSGLSCLLHSISLMAHYFPSCKSASI